MTRANRLRKFPLHLVHTLPTLIALSLMQPAFGQAQHEKIPALKSGWQSIGSTASTHNTYSMTSAWWISGTAPQKLANCSSQAGPDKIECVTYTLPTGKWEALPPTQAPYQSMSQAHLWLRNQTSILVCRHFLGSADAITCAAGGLPPLQANMPGWRAIGSAASQHIDYSMTSAWFYTPVTQAGKAPQQIVNCASSIGDIPIECQAYTLPAGEWEPMNASQADYQNTSQAHLWLRSQETILMCRRYLSSTDPITCNLGKLPPL